MKPILLLLISSLVISGSACGQSKTDLRIFGPCDHRWVGDNQYDNNSGAKQVQKSATVAVSKASPKTYTWFVQFDNEDILGYHYGMRIFGLAKPQNWTIKISQIRSGGIYYDVTNEVFNYKKFYPKIDSFWIGPISLRSSLPQNGLKIEITPKPGVVVGEKLDLGFFGYNLGTYSADNVYACVTIVK